MAFKHGLLEGSTFLFQYSSMTRAPMEICSLSMIAGKLRNFCSTELYGAPLEGSTIFLNRSSTCRMSMESYRLADLKYALFSGTGRKTKKIPRLKLFLWTVFKHGLLEGSTILLQHSAITRTQ